MPRLILSCLVVCVLGVTTAQAEEKTKTKELRKAVECFPAKDIIKFFSKFDKLKPQQRDTVDAIMTASFDVSDDRGLPHRIFIRDQGVDSNFTLLSDGAVPDFSSIKNRSKSSELCVEDPAREGLSRENDGIEFDIDFDVKYIDASGSHDLVALEDGAKDGKSFYKRLMPGPAKLLVPKMTHVSITYDDKATPANIRAWKNDTPLKGLTVEPFGKTHVVSLEQMTELGANRLVIDGGAYKLEPSPSIEKMKSLGFSEEPEDKEEKKED